MQDEWTVVDGVPYLARESFLKDRFIVFGRDPDGNLTFDLAEDEAEFEAATSGVTHASYDHALVFTVCNLGTTLLRIINDMTALELEILQKAEAKRR
ncbi:MAG: hypothetical protein LC676_17255 [Loktanella sp.]|nr:hypothetical protein [Loktanella sp.]